METRDEVGESVLHWAARCSNPEVIEEMVKNKRFDVNAREFIHGRTPLFMAGTKEMAEKLIQVGATNTVDANGIRAGEELMKKFGMRSPWPTTTSSKEPEKTEVTTIRVAIVGGDRTVRKNVSHTNSEVIILGSTVNETTPRPTRGVTGNDPHRPERFEWSQKRSEIAGTTTMKRGEPPIMWMRSEREPGQEVCVRIGEIEWFKSMVSSCVVLSLSLPFPFSFFFFHFFHIQLNTHGGKK